ncbi:MAG: co-chaperone GroES [Candidatus Woesearchaeota archaeon]
MNIEPIGERVLIEPVKEDEKTKGGIYIPESSRESKKKGIVRAVGKYKDGKELPVKTGDTILYGGYSSEEFEIDTKTYVILEFKDVVARLG